MSGRLAAEGDSHTLYPSTSGSITSSRMASKRADRACSKAPASGGGGGHMEPLELKFSLRFRRRELVLHDQQSWLAVGVRHPCKDGAPEYLLGHGLHPKWQRGKLARAPWWSTGIRFSVDGNGRLTAKHAGGRAHQTARGSFHGGATAALAESLGSVGALLIDTDKQGVVGISERQPSARSKEYRRTATGTLVHRGRTTHVGTSASPTRRAG